MSEIHHDKAAAVKAPVLREGDEWRAALTVAANSRDAKECLMLLEMLGLPLTASERQERKAS